MCHFPHCDKCPICIQARLTARSAFRIDKELTPSPTDEYQVSIDLGDHSSHPDCDGNRWIFYGVEGHTDWGHAEPIGSKSSAITKEELEKFVNEIRQRCGPNVKIKIRCHSDEGTEFQGDCLEFIRSEGWKRTTTGPYTHSVPLVETEYGRQKNVPKLLSYKQQVATSNTQGCCAVRPQNTQIGASTQERGARRENRH